MTLPLGLAPSHPRHRRVRTIGGVLRYGAPIGAAITTRLVRDDHDQPVIPGLTEAHEEDEQ